jgi:hypothetical protein
VRNGCGKSASLNQSPISLQISSGSSRRLCSLIDFAVGFLVLCLKLHIAEFLFVLEEWEVSAGDPIPEDCEGAIAARIVGVMEVMALSSPLADKTEETSGSGKKKEAR